MLLLLNFPFMASEKLYTIRNNALFKLRNTQWSLAHVLVSVILSVCVSELSRTLNYDICLCKNLDYQGEFDLQ